MKSRSTIFTGPIPARTIVLEMTEPRHHDGRFVQSLLTRFTDLSQEDLLQIAVRLSSFSHGSYILYGVRTLFTGFLTVMSPLAAEQ